MSTEPRNADYTRNAVRLVPPPDPPPTVWFRCACGMEAVSAHADGGRVELAIWQSYRDYGMGWRERARRVWAAVRGRDTWHDQVVLTVEEAARFGAWLHAHGSRP